MDSGFLYAEKTGDLMDRIIDDIKKMTVSMAGAIIRIDLRACRNPACAQIVLLGIIKLSPDNVRVKSRSVEVCISDSDTRYYRVPEHIDAYMLQTKILSDRVLKSFA